MSNRTNSISFTILLSWICHLGSFYFGITLLLTLNGQYTVRTYVHPCVRFRDTWDPFQLNPVGAEKESKRICFQLAQYLVAVIVGIAVLASAVIAKVGLYTLVTVYLQMDVYSIARSNATMKLLSLVSEGQNLNFPGKFSNTCCVHAVSVYVSL